MSAHRVLSEAVEIGKLIEELKTEHRTLAYASGQAGSSREKLLIQRADAKYKEVSQLEEEASELLEGRVRMGSASDQELTELLSRLDRHVVHIVRIKEQLEREFTAATGETRMFRERRMKSDYTRR